MGRAAISDDTIRAVVGDAMSRWRSQDPARHSSINLRLSDKDDKNKVGIHVGADGLVTVEKDVKSFKDWEKATGKAEAMFPDLLRQHKADPTKTRHKDFEVGGERYLLTVHLNGSHSMKKVSNVKDAKAMIDAADKLRAQMLATPPALREPLSLEVEGDRSSKWRVTMDTDLSPSAVMTKKPKKSGGGLFGFLGKIVDFVMPFAPILAVAFPPLGIALAGVSAFNSFSKGDVLGGLLSAATMAGAPTGVIRAVQGGRDAVASLKNGDVLGALASGAGAFGAKGKNIATGIQAVKSVAESKSPLEFIGNAAAATGTFVPSTRGVTNTIMRVAPQVESMVSDFRRGDILGAAQDLTRVVDSATGRNVTGNAGRLLEDAQAVGRAIAAPTPPNLINAGRLVLENVQGR